MSAPPASSTVLSFEDACRVVEEQAALIRAGALADATESVDLLWAAGRVLAQSVSADRDFPPFPRSTRDGYAVRAADLVQLPATLGVIGEIKAGESLDKVPSLIGSGQAVAIMTGAPVPAGADAVVMVEYTSQLQHQVEIMRGVSAGENVVPRGAEARAGALLLDRGLRLDAAAIALAASVGKSRLQVRKRPLVAVLTTGDEIVGVDATPGPTQIRNSNSYSLAAQIRRAGGEPVLLQVAPDEVQALRRLIEDGLQCDLLLITGGVSMGRYDLVEQALSELHAEFFFTGAKIQPGRPVVFGKCGNGYFFGLPGNPVSTMVTFELFARPMLEALSGQSPRPRTFLHARLKKEVSVETGLKRFLPAILSGAFEHAEVELVPWQGSGDVAAIARANCYIVIPADRERLSAGEWVAVMKPIGDC
jgi:molybdopterin molybdotransferase